MSDTPVTAAAALLDLERAAALPPAALWAGLLGVLKPGGHLLAFFSTRAYHRGVVEIEDAGFEIRDQLAWCHGGPAAVRPAWTTIALARKPLAGTVAANVLAHGTGALHIDACRVACAGGSPSAQRRQGKAPGESVGATGWVSAARPPAYNDRRPGEELGRWPANVLHDGSPEVLAAFAAFGERQSGTGAVKRKSSKDAAGNTGTAYGAESRPAGTPMFSYGDSGSVARFFKEVSPDLPRRRSPGLLLWLLRLVTPPGGLVADPLCDPDVAAAAAAGDFLVLRPSPDMEVG